MRGSSVLPKRELSAYVKSLCYWCVSLKNWQSTVLGVGECVDLSLTLLKTPLQRHVGERAPAISYEQTRLGAELSGGVGCPRATRAVGAAVGANPLPIVEPCYRVVGTCGGLLDDAGGLARKA